METHFARVARAAALRRTQMELVIGSLLGDGTLMPTTSGFCFRVHHGLAQRFLVDWKYEQLRFLVRSSPRECGRGYYFRTVTHPVFADLRSAFYLANRKIVPFDLLNAYLTPFAMAVWIMDDGAADGKQLRLNTQSFTIDEAYALTGLLQDKFQIPVTVNLDKGKPRLRFASTGMPFLTNLVAPYILPEMRYKCPLLRSDSR